MAELATVARPYAEAYYEVVRGGDVAQAGAELDAVAAVAADPQLRRFADDPKVNADQVLGLIAGVSNVPLSDRTRNLVSAVVDNGRIAALPEIAAQFHALANAGTGVSQATVESAFPIDDAQLADVRAALERRFDRKLDLKVQVAPELIGGIRVVVGDEVLDTSVRARLEQMKTALTA